MAENKNIEVGGRLHSIATGNVLAGANEIFDDEKNKKQGEINTETYTLVNEIKAKLDSLSPEQQGALEVATKANKNEANLGYYVCSTEENVAAKVISDATGYILSKGGSMKVKMTNTNTAANATLNINSTGAKPLYYDSERASANNSWEAGETIEVYYDGTSYYANNVASDSSDGVFDVSKKYPTSGAEGGNTYTLKGALLVLNTNLPSNKKKGGMSIRFVQSSDNKYVQYRLIKNTWSTTETDWQGVDEKPTFESDSLVKSGGVYKEIAKIVGGQESVTLDFSIQGRYTDVGVLVESEFFKATDLIDVSKYKKIIISGTLNVDSITCTVLYNDSTKITHYSEKDLYNSQPFEIDVTNFNKIKVSCAKNSVINIVGIFNGILEGKANKSDVETLTSNFNKIKPIDNYFLETISFGRLSNVSAIGYVKGNISKITVSAGSYKWTVEGYKVDAQNTKQKVYDSKWMYGTEPIIGLDSYDCDFYIVKISSESDISDSEIQGFSARVYKKNPFNKADALIYTKYPFTLGNLQYHTWQYNIHSELGNGISEITIQCSIGLRYYIEGYSDKYFKTRVYESGWIPNSDNSTTELFTIKTDKSLYYAVVAQKYGGAAFVENDYGRIVAYVGREYSETYVEKEHNDKDYTDVGKLPEYYFDNDYITGKVRSINNLLKGCIANGDAFFFITDEHWYDGARSSWNARKAPNIIKYLHDNTLIDKSFCGGDRYDGYDIDFAKNMLSAIGNNKFFPVIGNHEFITEDSTNNTAYASAYQHLDLNTSVKWGEIGKEYYYVDNTIQKIRYIVLQGFDKADTEDPQSGWVKTEYNAEQITWFTNVALNVENGWTIIVFTHALLFGSDDKHELAIPTWNTSYMSIYNAIKGYNGNGTIAAVIQGHLHWDANSSIVCDNGNVVPVVITTCDRLYSAGEFDQSERVPNTVTEQAFDVVILNKAIKKLYFVRIGGYSCRADLEENTRPEIREFTY